MESLDKVLEQITGGTMQVLAASTQNTLKSMGNSGLVLANDLVKGSITNPDTYQEVLSAATAANSTVKMGYPPNSPDVSEYAKIRAFFDANNK